MGLSPKTEKWFHLTGWLLFLVCAIFFIMQYLLHSSALGLIGSIVFLFGCIVFLIPLVGNWKGKEG